MHNAVHATSRGLCYVWLKHELSPRATESQVAVMCASATAKVTFQFKGVLFRVCTQLVLQAWPAESLQR